MGRVATKRDLESLWSELRAELHSALRSQLITFTGIMLAMNTALFTALRLI